MAREPPFLLVLCVTLLTIGKHVCAGPLTNTKCPIPKEVPHGTVKVLGQDPGDKMLVTCDEGYWLKGPSTNICQRDGRWSGDTSSCEVVSCPFLKDPPDGIIHYSRGQGYKDTLTLECRPGYIYTEKLPRICEVNNQWSEREGQCLDKLIKICPTVSDPQHGLVKMTGRRYNDTVTVTCDDGYQYTGSTVRVCQGDGSWSGKVGICQEFKGHCPNIMEIDNGAVKMTGRRYYDTVTVTCEDGYQYTGSTVRVCQGDGSWSGRVGVCQDLPSNCPSIKGIGNGVLEMTGRRYNDTVTVTCHEGSRYTGTSYRVCLRNGSWSGTDGFCENEAQNINTGSIIGILIGVSLLIAIVVGGLIYCHRRNQAGMSIKIDDPEEHQDLLDREQTIIDHLLVDKILPLLDNVGQNVKDNINKKDGSEEKAKYLLSKLGADHKKLKYAMAAVQPELFERVYGREPSPEERDACVKGTITHLRQEVIRDQHKPESEFDKKVDFDVNFIHLVLVNDRRRGNTDDAFTIEDILPPKRPNWSGDKSEKKSIILKGRAGVGKTTLLQYLCRLWAKEEWGQQFAVIFLIKMRVIMMIKEKLTLTELLTNYSQFNSDKTMLSSWIPSNLDRIGIVIDGIDELPNVAHGIRDAGKITSSDDREDPVKLCFSIMKGHLMGRSTRIITSRPFITLHVLEHDRLIEIYGLKDKQIHQYIDKNVVEPSRERVRSMLTGVPHLMSLCQITFYCMAFCRIFGALDVDTDELNTYTSIMAFVVLHYACRRKQPERPGVHDIVKKAQSFLPQLAKLAFQSLDASGGMQIVFTEEDLSSVEHQGPMEDTGLIQSETLPLKTGHQESITEFIHLSIQEFLGMAEISNRSDDVKSFLNVDTTDNESSLTKQFLLGLVFDTKNKWIKAVKKALVQAETNDTKVTEIIKQHVKALCNQLGAREGSSTRFDPRTFKLFLLASESQSEDLANEVGAVLATQNGRLNLTNNPMTALDMKALTFVLDQGIALTYLGLGRCSLDEACIQILAKYIKGERCPRELSLANNNLSPEGAAHLSTALKENKTLTTLSLYVNRIGDEGALHLSEALKCNKSITKLNLQANRIGDKGALHLSEALKCNTSITKLDLQTNQIGAEGALHLSEALKWNTSITELKLWGNDISDSLKKKLDDSKGQWLEISYER